MKNRKKLFIILGSVVVVLIAAALIKKKLAPDGLEVYVETISNKTIIETVSANGKIQPEKEVKISSEVPGEIIVLSIKEGDNVSKGDLLVKINPDLLLAGVQRMEASVNTSKANLSNSKARLAQAKARYIQSEIEYNRTTKLFADKAVSQSEMDQSTSSFEVAKAEVEAADESVNAAMFSVKSAEASLKEARDNLNRTEIYSPMDGIVSKLDVEAGERVVGTAQMAGTEMLRVANMDRMEVNVEVNESDIVRVSLGDSVDIEVDAYIERKFKGLVTEMGNSANDKMASAEQVTTFDVKIRILKSSYQDLIKDTASGKSPFRPGMSATVEIKTNRAIDILAVPIQAVTLRSDSSEGLSFIVEKSEDLKECVFVVEDGVAKKINVTTGIQDENYIQIISPTSITGDVVKGPYAIISKKLEDGKVVEIISEESIGKFGKKD